MKSGQYRKADRYSGCVLQTTRRMNLLSWRKFYTGWSLSRGFVELCSIVFKFKHWYDEIWHSNETLTVWSQLPCVSVYGSVNCSWLTCEAGIFCHNPCSWVDETLNPCTSWANWCQAKVAGSNPTRSWIVSGCLPTTVVYLRCVCVCVCVCYCMMTVPLTASWQCQLSWEYVYCNFTLFTIVLLHDHTNHVSFSGLGAGIPFSFHAYKIPISVPLHNL